MSYNSRERYHQMMRRKERETQLYMEMHPPKNNMSATEAMSRIVFPEYYEKEDDANNN